MSDLANDEYQKEYQKAYAELDAAAQGKPVATTEPEAKQPEPEKAPEAKTEEPAKQSEEKPQVDPVAVEELRQRLEKTEKALKDTQAWGTKNAQRLKEFEQERERQQRAASKPAILEQAPELEQAIRYVTSDPEPQRRQEEVRNQWVSAVDGAHPGIFTLPDSDELVQAVAKRAQELGDAWNDPLVAIREITAEKVAHAERQIGKRFAAEAAKLQQKSAMSVPGAGSSAVTAQPVDKELERVNRIMNMSPAEFEKEVRRVKGY